MKDTRQLNQRIIIAGGSGFLGTALANYFTERGQHAVILTRSPREQNDRIRKVKWDGQSLGPWANELEGAHALINLAGLSVNCRYHARNRKQLVDSRLNSTRILGEAVGRCANPPRVWLNSSTATIYRHTFGPAWDEHGEIGGCAEAKDIFSVELATEWEREFNQANTPRTRKVAIRLAMVLGHARNSVLPNMVRLVRLGLGGSMAGGRQFVSWIHHEDFCRAVEWLIEHAPFSTKTTDNNRSPLTRPSATLSPSDGERDGVRGNPSCNPTPLIVNLAAPHPVTNAEFMGTLRDVCGVPFGLPAAFWMLAVGAFFLRTETELINKSRNVVPGRLLAGGFTFRHPLLRPALEDLVMAKRNEHNLANPSVPTNTQRAGEGAHAAKPL